MRNKEFIKRVKELGFEVKIELGKKGEFVEFRIGDDEDDFVVIWPKFTFAISTIEYGFAYLKDPLPLEELYKLCFEYASTPVKDREEEKKFLIQHKFLVSIGSNPVNLVKYKDKNNYRAIRCLFDNQFYQAQFTLKEIEEIKKKFDTDLKDFELVEVVDE